MNRQLKKPRAVAGQANKLLFFTALLSSFYGCSPNSSERNAVNTDIKPVATSPPIQKDIAKPSLPIVASLEVANPSAFARQQSPLYFSYHDLGVEPSAAEAKILAVKLQDKVIPSQLVDKDADGTMDGLAIALNLAAEEVVDLDIVADSQARQASFASYTQAEISHKEGGKWVAHTKTDQEGFQEYVGGHFKNVNELTPPKHYTDHSNWIRYEGPGIESDKVGYRVYLDWRNGYDIFGKKVPDTILQTVGQDGYESYHAMQSWGMDILKVGLSLGAGGFGYWDGKKIQMISNTEQRTATITNNGDIYSSFQIHYENWQVDSSTLDIYSQVSMVAGSRLAHGELRFSDSPPPMVVGVVKHPGTEFIASSREVPGDGYIYLGSWGKQTLNNDMLGMAVLLRKRDAGELVDSESSYATRLKTAGNFTDYYFTAAWEGEHNGGVASKEEFIAYLDKQVEMLNQPPRVRLKTRYSQEAKSQPLTAEKALSWAKKLADSELQRKTLQYHLSGWDTNRRRLPRFEYDIVGITPTYYDKLSELSGENKYAQVLPKITGSFIADDGTIAQYEEKSYNIDAVAPGVAVLRLYNRNQEEKYKIAASQLRRQLRDHPKTSEGAFWHKKKYPFQLWLDGVYMGMPFLAEYISLFENGENMEDVVKEFTLTKKYLRDPNTGLYYHAWDEKKQQPWADPETGLSPHFWGRGMGWLTMALVDVLDFIPAEDSELRQPLLQMIEEIAETLVKYRDEESKTWWQIMDMPNRAGNYRESSASAMFTYFFAKAVNNAYLPAKYKQVAIESYQGLINEFINIHRDGSISMTNQCLVAGLGYGRLGDYDYYMTEQVFQNDPKGNGPFVFASLEMYKLLK